MKLPLKDRKFLILLACVVIALVLEILSLAGFRLPDLMAIPLYLGLIVLTGYTVLKKGVRAALNLNFKSINLLMLIAVAGAFYLGQYTEAAVVIVLYVLGERLEDIGIENSKSALSTLVSRAPKTAFVVSTTRTEPIDRIPVGSIIRVKPGEMIPMDGRILFGETAIDESAITGEPIPRDKRAGDTVFAGTLNKFGAIEFETTHLSKDTTFSKIIRLTFESSVHKSDTQKFIERFSGIYTPSILIAAILLFLIPVFLLHQSPDRWLEQSITLLVIACPCALVISTPVAIYAAIGNASARGAVIKGGKYLEALARAKVIALDKTRTITSGNPIVTDVVPLHDTTHEELLACASGAELLSEHPLAKAIVQACLQAGYEPHAAESYMTHIGKGATAKCLVCEDETICVGKLEFIHERESPDPEAAAIVETLTDQGKTGVVVSFGKGIAGVLGLMDEIKPDSVEAIHALQQLGLHTVMLTGDHNNAGKYVGSKTGIDEVFSNLLPDEKASIISSLQSKRGALVMVGDGINDAPALACSEVGIAMAAAGSDTAIETANIALMNDKLSLIPFLIRLGRITIRRIRTNTILAIGVKLVFILLAFMGYSHLVLAIIADVGVTLVVILMSLRLMHIPYEKVMQTV